MATNLPAELTSFVGRERELAEAKRLLANTRLLTLTGPGGVGKTRLALRLAAAEAEAYGDGAWLVELASLTHGTLVPQAVATVFGLVEEQSGALTHSLMDYLKARELLLVLDNCEHLLEASAELALALLKTCPSLIVLTTSREPLNVPGEVAWLVPSLGAPRGPALEQVRGAEAVQLFLERASAARPSFELTADNGAAVARICQRLDGIPLAIELAAVRTRTLAVEQIADRLDNRFDLLIGPRRGSVPRHVTLKSLVDWSHELLSEPECALFRRLAVFAGGWTIEAAEAVCAGAPVEDVLQVLTTLVEKSLVLAEDRGVDIRYRFLEVIRQYAAEVLRPSGELPELQRRHALWFLERANMAGPRVFGPAASVQFAQLEADRDNLRASLEWSKANDIMLGLELAGTLMQFWYRFGYLTEGRQHLGDLLSASAPASPAGEEHTRWAAARGRALLAAGRLAMRQGAAQATELLDGSMALARELGDPRALALSLSYRGRLAYWQKDLAGAEARLKEALETASQAQEPGTIVHALHGLGLTFQALGDLSAAKRYYDQELAEARAIDDQWLIAIALHQRALLAIDEGDLGAASELLREAMGVWRLSSDRVLAIRLLEGAAHLALVQDQPLRAIRLAGAASNLGETYGDTGSETLRAIFVERLAAARRQLGSRAAAAWEEGRALSSKEAFEHAARLEPEPPPRDPLTPRERQVAALLARGLTNREIAELLIVSEGTAKVHVEHILNKLGMSSRAEVAAWAARTGLAEAAAEI